MTNKIYYKNAYIREFESRVLACEEGKGAWFVTLESTAFYPEGGGQPADHGILGDAGVLDVHERDGIIFHTCDKPLEVGSIVKGAIDWERRFDHMQQHSGEHIVSGMLCSRFGCDNIGFHMGEQSVQIDYNADITWEEVLDVGKCANQYIWENHAFVELWPSQEELKTLNYRSKKALEGAVRITEFPGADMCACCGTHVAFSSEVGLVKMLSVQKIKEGVRIEMLSGKRALDYLSLVWEQNQGISQALSAKPTDTLDAVVRLKEESSSLKYRIGIMEIEKLEKLSREYAGAKDPLVIVGELAPDNVRRLCDMISEKAEGCCRVFAGIDGNYRYSIINKGEDIRELVKSMNSALNGRGGGRDGFAQGSAICTREEILKYFS
ncbi:MAG: alanine--tRNA ligase-related protein [Lachnospiraceae bacterium]|nr:alanine--tRNA ligase-related protein [Lachnospiraceae bacterium]